MMMLALAAALAIPIDPATLDKLPHTTAALSVHGTVQSCTGVPLMALLANAGVPSGEAVRGAALNTIVTADAGDGYRIVFSLGELDALLGDAGVLVADHCDGKPLAAADGPLRLVVPGEKRGARSVRQLIRLGVETLPR